ncbi:MAG: sodium:proton antiporter [Bacteroidaceae bacterium]|jgi:Na+/H+ antiporter NhaD/arsenite permease-like protein|nr:sodium:proton antiporter [Bacteroidaceae bacterium]
MTLIIVAVLAVGYALMATEQSNHISRAAVAMICGVIAWVLYMLRGGTFLELMHPDEWSTFLTGNISSPSAVKEFVATHILVGYIAEACSVILFLIATNTIVEVLNNNGVFDPIAEWIRTRNSKKFLWILTCLTFLVSANIDNLTTVVLMLTIMNQIVRSHAQKVVYACAIMMAANLGGSVSVIGDMTSLMLWVRGVVTPSSFFLGLILPALSALVVFNLCTSTLLHGNVEIHSFLGRFRGDDSPLAPWAKTLLLVVGIAGIWAIPTFHAETKLPPFLGALCVLALVWVVDGILNLERNGMDIVIRRDYVRDSEFISMKTILYFLGVSLGVGALKETGAINYISDLMTTYIGNEYIYASILGLLSSVVDNVPLMQIGLNAFDLDTANNASAFALNGSYWQLLSLCSAIGGSLLMIGSLAGQQAMESEKVRMIWYIRHFLWRVFLTWAVAMAVFWLTHELI